MSLHPDLDGLAYVCRGDKLFRGEGHVYEFTDKSLTAFAVAVAQAERERCANWLCTTIPPLYDLAGAMIDGLPNPEWAGGTDA